MATSSPKKVLIVDDEEHITIAIEFLMQQQGYETAIAYDGESALALLSSGYKPDVMILDVMMPRKDGLELAAEIRRNEAFQDSKIIFLTARGTREDRLTGYSSGGDVYLTKPFDNDRLTDLVAEVLEN